MTDFYVTTRWDMSVSKHVTPYMHIMVFHVPMMLRVFGNIKHFSGQGK